MANPAPHPNPIEQAIAPWLHLLNQLYPPTGALLIGAGGGTGPWVQALQTLGIASTTLVEADDAQFENLQRNMQNHSGWRLVNRLVAAQTEHLAFFRASHNAESGLIEPESLRSLWPNLKTIHKESLQAITLAELQQESATPANWLLVDCLPGLPIIQGAAQHLAGVDVIVVRVLLTQNAHDAHGTRTATADQLQPALQTLGFRCLAIETSRHPSIGHALFVRDTEALVQQQQQQLAQQTKAHAQALVEAKAAAAKHAEELAVQVQRLTQATADAEKLAAERQEQIDTLQAENIKATEQAHAAAKCAEQAKAAAAEATAAASAAAATAAKQAEERAAQVQLLTQARAAAEKLATERQQLIEQLRSELKDCIAHANASRAAAAEQTKIAKAALEEVSSSLCEANRQAEERATQVQTLHQAKLASDKLATERQQQNEKLQAQLKQAIDQAQTAMAQAQEARAGSELLKQAFAQVSEESAKTASEIRSLLLDQHNKVLNAIHLIPKPDIAPIVTSALDAQITKHTATGKENLKEVENRLRADMNKGFGNSVRQIEAFMRIQSYLGTSDSLGEFHGWPISPDIGIVLLEKMREQNYDLIIEFGSGTSTALFAKAVDITRQNKTPASLQEGLSEPSEVTTRIVTFEHDKFYHDKTSQLLKSRGLDHLVTLEHAPLIEWREGEDTYLYYDCQATLSQLAKQYTHRRCRILLLIDGPPGATCTNARYPAVPMVFAALGRHHIDVVLDDASRPEEKATIELWRSFWKKRSMRVSDSNLQSEKGIYLASSQR